VRVLLAIVPLLAGVVLALLAGLRRSAPRAVPTGPLDRVGERPRVVVVGGGFGGLSAALGLARSSADLDLVLVDRNNYHLFTPLLYQVAVGVVDSKSITYPLRAIAHRNGFRFLLADVEAVDTEARRLQTSVGSLAYDYLVLALGSVTNFYGLSEVAARAFPLKTVADAEAIRSAVIASLEQADVEADPDQRRRLLTFPIVGGGPTGLELAGALSALLSDVSGREYPGVSESEAHVEVLEAMDTVLAGWAPDTQTRAVERLREQGVKFHFRSGLRGVAGSDYVVGAEEERLAADLLVWAAGVRGNPLVEQLPGDRTRDNRLRVDASLRLPADARVSVIGDCAAFVPEGAERPLPATAPVAIQQGAAVARNILHAVRGEAAEPFEYRHPGNLVALGRHRAAAEIGRFHFDGWPAWLIWRAIHLSWLMGLRNRLQVLLDWSVLYLGPRQTEWLQSTAWPARFRRHPARDAATPPDSASTDEAA
jgi:NADH dehydrogenase